MLISKHNRYNVNNQVENADREGYGADEDRKPSGQEDELPEPEVLSTREEDDSDSKLKSESASKTKVTPRKKKSLSSRYHLSHKATFFGLLAAIIVLVVLAGGIVFVVQNQTSVEDGVGEQVVISQATLEGLGVNRTAVADEGTELIIGPNARFDKQVQIGGNTSIGGQLILNSRLTASDASLSRLQAGETSLEQLSVNGDGTLTNINVREDLVVVGETRLQGTTTVSGLLSVENSLNISGNTTVGGSLTAATVQAGTLRASNSLIVSGRIVSSGNPPSVSPGPAAGSNGTVSISGNDVAGTVGVNTGTGAGNGIVANITFRNSHSATPRVIVTPIGNVGSFYVFRTSSGFNIGVGNSLSPGGYAFDYLVIQ